LKLQIVTALQWSLQDDDTTVANSINNALHPT
jgi:hypothetical protein